jgi:hypothetical protein
MSDEHFIETAATSPNWPSSDRARVVEQGANLALAARDGFIDKIAETGNALWPSNRRCALRVIDGLLPNDWSS